MQEAQERFECIVPLERVQMNCAIAEREGRDQHALNRSQRYRLAPIEQPSVNSAESVSEYE